MKRCWGAFGLAWTAICGPLVACETPTGLEAPLLRTGESVYELEARDSGSATSMDYLFQNRTGGPVFLPNCRGAYGFVLERRQDGAWVAAYKPALLACLSSPIVIDPGASFADTLRIWGALPGASGHPKWDVVDPSGTYRLVLAAAVSSYVDSRPHGPELDPSYRVSNSFLVSVD